MKKVCVVSGGSAGIGKSVVDAFVAQDYDVYNLDITASDIGTFVQCDMTDREQIESAIELIRQKSGQIDALVSNAGMHFSSNIEQTSEDDFDRVMNLNVKGAYHLVKNALPLMKTLPASSIVLIASDQAVIGKTNSFAYNMSKAALASMTRTTALDYASDGVRCNAVCPGTIETPLYHTAINNYCNQSGEDRESVHRQEADMQPVGRIGQPEEVAALVSFLCSDNASFITGSLQMIDGGYTAR